MKRQQSHWALYFIFWLFAIIVGSALIGAIGFPIIGPLFGSHRTLLEHAMAGAQHLGFVALIWAPAIALVLCVMRAYRNKSQR